MNARVNGSFAKAELSSKSVAGAVRRIEIWPFFRSEKN